MVRLVSSRLKPVNKPMKKKTSLGPYRSRAQPPAKVTKAQKTIYTEKRLDVAARVRSNSFARGLKKTPNEKRVPEKINVIKPLTNTITQP